MIQTETPRLIIRNWTVEDLPAYADIVADPEVMKHIGSGQAQTFEEAKVYLEKCMDSIETRGWARFAVEYKATGELIGFCGFAWYEGELDFGWRYARKYWGQGMGTEAAHAVLELGKNKFKFPRIVCMAFEDNVGSIKIIERIGMRHEKDFELFGRQVRQYSYEKK